MEYEKEIDPRVIWEEYQRIVSYMTEKKVYQIVKKNEDFFEGRHWEGMADNVEIAKPTMNILQRIGKYQIAMLSGNDIGVQIKSPLGKEDENALLAAISNEVKSVIEQAKINEASRIVIRNAYVGGACYMMQSFDADYETGQESKGKINNEVINVRRMHFGNPYSNDIQKQPYIIVTLRQYIDQVKEEAEEMGVKNIDDIKADSDEENIDDDTSDKLVTVLIKFYKKKTKIQVPRVIVNELGEPQEIIEEKEVKTVHFVKCTKDVVIIPETDLGYTRYPISRFGWDHREDSFLYDTPMTWNIVNQVFINKSYAYCHEYAFKSAFPKRIYDQVKIDIDDWDANNDIGVAGADQMGKVLDFSKMPDFSNQIIELIQQTEDEMEKNMGVNDAALGNIKPDNASAIAQLQEAAAVPLKIQENNRDEMWEDTIRNIIDIMIASYGIREVLDEDNKPMIIDFTQLKGMNYKLDIDTGSSAPFSEIGQLNTLQTLFNSGQIPLTQFLKVYPAKYIAGRDELLKYAEEKEQMEKQLAQLQTQQQSLGVK